MARGRKLFPTYGSALANGMLVTLGRDRLVDKFVKGYVAEYDRRGILGEASRDKELADTIGREIVLAMIVEARRGLPGFFGKRHLANLKDDEKLAIEAFSRELIGALDRAWAWNGEDRRQFRRDLALYSVPGSGETSVAGKRKRRSVPGEELPFVGRVALLLDPSMIEQARRASRKFHGEVARIAQKLLKQTLRPTR